MAYEADAGMFSVSIVRRLILLFVIASVTFGGRLSAEAPSDDFSQRTVRKQGVKNLLTPEFLDAASHVPGDLGPLPPVPIPADNPQTPAKIELGKMLFFDTRSRLIRP